ncbi:hypothetical protein MA5S0422_1728 [Mycobacteroides abscessus 5S-0422]|uniref:Uncharacterized protein n=1 Tax=Mycobacteroides abscessus subsp. bolletii 1513 TaxID=1299321 RepID=X8DUB5_9MYCO|nr:hypothetical protein MA5S0304_0742 [Mycobacteroides abscessus 5S-0304]EIU17369.1 hypothetical protein MA5S0421_0994 [Mycobacteroides abscessus 5S-0421]EIU18216.1 hypothetical protein MA5S0422_1728 [Mycobacteroides abscessus 5S-0422]EIU28368.1 hypothetical protein MA5S0708_1220 [Mycobacteroides abscessus 5S-0708]EIU33147.1 hypothetical protein MA5S0817_0773 [Mycobacteroides abscessus 5S-0817]EIU33923.1 hypothetical protein MA5S1212_1163 [Mycobacteroides abscessus 5S-1212]EIU45371.1 hypothet
MRAIDPGIPLAKQGPNTIDNIVRHTGYAAGRKSDKPVY